MAQCTATSKRTRQQCTQLAAVGWTVCRHHGAHNTDLTVNGKRSQYLPAKLGAAVQAAMQDPDLMRLDNEASLTAGRLDAILEEYDTWVSAGEEPLWWQDFDDAQRANTRLMQPVSLEAEFQRRITEYTELRRKIIESAVKIETGKHQVYTIREAEALVRYLVSTVTALVRDPHDRAAVLTDMALFLRGRHHETGDSKRVNWGDPVAPDLGPARFTIDVTP